MKSTEKFHKFLKTANFYRCPNCREKIFNLTNNSMAFKCLLKTQQVLRKLTVKIFSNFKIPRENQLQPLPADSARVYTGSSKSAVSQ